MNFITLPFAFFFLFVLGMSTIFRRGTLSYKIFLLSFNLVFYAFAGVYFIPLLLFVGCMNRQCAKLTSSTVAKEQKTRKRIIGINVFIHVLLLTFYKYYEFLLVSMEAGLNYLGIALPFFNLISTTELLFPIGLSFYTFQGLSYSIDQYRNPENKPESLFNVLLFVSFFPTILAGPLLRGHDFFVQLNKDNRDNSENTNSPVNGKKHNGQSDTLEGSLNVNLKAPLNNKIGQSLDDKSAHNEEDMMGQSDQKITSQLTKIEQLAHIAQITLQNKEIRKDIATGFAFILSGLFKKVVLASYLSEHIVRDVFLTPDFYSSTTVLIAVYAYAMQIYCDFSGYSDIAIGIGLLMGYKLPQNFNAPYLACSVQDFWRRWHITLSSWLRDYLYIPLGGNKKGNKAFNLIITMSLGGLWHGSHLRFLIWGTMHGIGLSVVYFWQSILTLFASKGPQASSVKHARKGNHKQGKEKARKARKLRMQKKRYQSFSSAPLSEEPLVLKPLLLQKKSWFKRLLQRISKLLGWFITFHFVSILWVFFRAEDTQTAFNIIERIIAFNLPGDGFAALVPVAIFLTMFLQAFGPHIFRFFVWFLQKLWSPIQVFLIAVLCALILKLGPDGVLPFIYFQF